MTRPLPRGARPAPRSPSTYRSFAVYSGRWEPSGRAPVYDNAVLGDPLIRDAPWLFLDLVAGGLVSTSNVSVYIRVYDDGHGAYLGPKDRFRAMPASAAGRWNDHADRYGLPRMTIPRRSKL